MTGKRNNRIRSRLLAAFLAAVCLLGGCGAEPAADSDAETSLPEEPTIAAADTTTGRQAADAVFSLNFDSGAGTNPLRAQSSANLQFWSLLYDSVFVVEEDFTVSSEIVTSYTTDDYIWWVFHIDTSVTFSDGSALTAADVAYSIQRAQQVEYYAGRLSCIYGVSALDGSSFAISTKYANTQLPLLLNIPIIQYGAYFEDDPIGTGPYMLNTARSALVQNPEYRHAGEQPLDTIYLRDYMDASDRITAFEDASIDIVTNDPTGMYNLGYGSGNETRFYDTTNLHYVGFNTSSLYFQNAAARRAVAWIIDRDYVVDTLMDGCGVTATLPVHPTSALYDSEYAETTGYDPEKCASAFAAAGVDDLDGDDALEMLVTGIVVELDIRFIVNNDSVVKVRAARRICEELNSLGITTTLYELSWNDYINALAAGNYDMYYGELRMSADWDISALFAVPGDDDRSEGNWGKNYARTTDSTYTELYRAFSAAPEEQRYDAFQAAVQYVTENAILLPICFERRQVLTHPGVVSGIRATQYDLFHHFLEWRINLQ